MKPRELAHLFKQTVNEWLDDNAPSRAASLAPDDEVREREGGERRVVGAESGLNVAARHPKSFEDHAVGEPPVRVRLVVLCLRASGSSGKDLAGREEATLDDLRELRRRERSVRRREDTVEPVGRSESLVSGWLRKTSGWTQGARLPSFRWSRLPRTFALVFVSL